jgi:hypothetical protein
LIPLVADVEFFFSAWELEIDGFEWAELKLGQTDAEVPLKHFQAPQNASPGLSSYKARTVLSLMVQSHSSSET